MTQIMNGIFKCKCTIRMTKQLLVLIPEAGMMTTSSFIYLSYIYLNNKYKLTFIDTCPLIFNVFTTISIPDSILTKNVLSFGNRTSSYVHGTISDSKTTFWLQFPVSVSEEHQLLGSNQSDGYVLLNPISGK